MAALMRVDDGLPVPQIYLEVGIGSATFYKWRAKYGGMDASMRAHMMEFDGENHCLKKMTMKRR